MRPTLSSSLLLAMTAALAACGPVSRGLESVHQPVVQRTDYVFDVTAGSLSSAEEQRLTAWFDALKLGYGDQIAVDDRSGSTATRTAIAAIVARYGLFLADTAPVTAGSADIAGARVIVSRSAAHVEGCPDWRRASQPEFASSSMSNYGCAVNSNLAAMIANPADLVQGQDATQTDPITVTRAIKSYRDAKPTGDDGLPGGVQHDSVIKTTGGN